MDLSLVWQFLQPVAETVLRIVIILIPLRIAVEFLEEYGVIRWLAMKLRIFAAWFGISFNALIVMITGWLLGVYLGGTMLTDYHAEKKMTQKDTNRVVSVWMFAHGLIDETVVFTAIGASLFWILGVRMFFALVVIKAMFMMIERGVKIMDA